MPGKSASKLLYLTYYWPPSGGPGVQRTLKFSKYLSKLNIDTFILTVDETKASYPLIDETLMEDVSEDLKVIKTNSFEPLELYRRLNKKKEIPYSGFVNMDKTSLFQKFSRFIRGNFFIPDARVGWNKYAYREAIKLIATHKLTSVITSSPPHSTQLIGLKLQSKLHTPWIADMRDPWTDIFFYNDFYHLPFVKRFDAKLEKRVLENADAVIVVSHDIKRLFLSKSDKIDPSKIHVIPNGFDEEDFLLRGEEKNPKDFIITYTGTLADQYPVGSFIEALKRVLEIHDDVRFRIVGKVSDNIMQKLEVKNLKQKFEYLGYLSHTESVSYLMQSDLLLLIIPDIENNKGILTGKLFEYIGARKPILNLGPTNGDAAEIIEECKAGETYDYSDCEGITNYLLGIIKNWKEGEMSLAENETYLKYSRKELTDSLIKVIQDVEVKSNDAN